MNDELTVLRTMDPADPAASAGSERARRDLTTILTTHTHAAEPTHAAPSRPGTRPAPHRGHAVHPSRRPRRAGYLLAAAAAVMAVGVGLSAVPPGPAYAGWVAMPAPASAPIARDAEQRCQELWSGVDLATLAAEAEASSDGYADPATMRGVLTERRGPWTFTILRGEDGQLGDCLFNRTGLFGNSSGGGSMSMAPRTADPAGTDVDQALLGALGPSRRTLGPLRWGGDSSMVYTYGRAGEDVAGLTVHTAEHGPVQASVQNGIWAAWWPSGSEPTVPFDQLRATVQAADGSTREIDLATVPWDHTEAE